jgi:hypothetical protein
MPRDITSDFVDALSQSGIIGEFFFEGVFDSSTLRLWTGSGAIVFDGETYQGGGDFRATGSVKESYRTSSSFGLSVTLSGVSQTNIALALGGTKQSGQGVLSLVLFDESFSQIGAMPIFSGTLNGVSIGGDGNTSQVLLNYESKLFRSNTNREVRLSNEYQQSRFSDDKGFEYLTQLASARIFWGRADPGRLRL